MEDVRRLMKKVVADRQDGPEPSDDKLALVSTVDRTILSKETGPKLSSRDKLQESPLSPYIRAPKGQGVRFADSPGDSQPPSATRPRPLGWDNTIGDLVYGNNGQGHDETGSHAMINLNYSYPVQRSDPVEKCPNCGAVYNAAARNFCTECGKRRPIQVTPPTEASGNPGPSKKKPGVAAMTRAAGTYHVYRVGETVTFVGHCQTWGVGKKLNPGVIGRIERAAKADDVLIDVRFPLPDNHNEVVSCNVEDLVLGEVNSQ
jgi:hypothetical protein